jgi:hypothetical protein
MEFKRVMRSEKMNFAMAKLSTYPKELLNLGSQTFVEGFIPTKPV